jgi:hypothetical protein
MSQTPRYCSACGERLSPGDNFCAACGDSVTSQTEGHSPDEADTSGDASGYTKPAGGHEPGDGFAATRGGSATRDRTDGTTRDRTDRATRSPTGAATDDDGRWLRQRVADLRARGWEVTRDEGDRVELVDRGVGSIPAHLLIFFFTSGVGNLLYGWYSWTWGAPERLVTADGHEEVDSGGDGLGSLIAAVVALGVLGINAMLFMIALLAGVPSVAVSGLLFTLLLLVGTVVFRGDVDTTSLSKFGRERDVDEQQVRTPPESCATCGDRVIEGERREFADQFYLAGVPVQTYEKGSNTYCADCVADDRGPDDVDDLERELERLRTDADGQSRASRERERP